ncbi:MAG: hypothetical protein ACRCXL_13550 [Dermatophilaceae bacterium]
MEFFDRLLGRVPAATPHSASSSTSASRLVGPQTGEDERAVARYRYLLRTSSPEQLEAIHAEAFAGLTSEQRQQVLRDLSENTPDGERPASAEPRDLARAATRAEMRAPGTLLGGRAGGLGMGGVFAGSMLGTVAGVVVGSMVASSLLSGFESSPEAAEAGESGDGGEGGGLGDAGSGGDADSVEAGGASGVADQSGYDAGGFGGGDFGGGGDLGGF